MLAGATQGERGSPCAARLDLVVSPPHALPALRHGASALLDVSNAACWAVLYAMSLRRTLLSHPGAAPLLMTAPMDGPSAVAVGELLMTALEEAGLSSEDAARAMYLLIVQVVGSVALDVAETDGRAPLPDERDRIAERRRSMGGVDPAILPRTAAAGDVMAAFIGEDQFR